MALHRPYIRKAVREEVERRALKDEKGRFLDANTKEPIEGKYDLGHVRSHEFWREALKAEQEGLTQKEFNDRMNNPDFYQIEDPHDNRSRKHEDLKGRGEKLGNSEGNDYRCSADEKNSNYSKNSNDNGNWLSM